MSLLTEIEKTIDRAFRSWTQRAFGPERANDLVILHRAILEEILGKVEVLARGQRVFPYGYVVVTIVGDTARRREVLQAAFGERLPSDVQSALRARRCETPQGFAVKVNIVAVGLQAIEIGYFPQAPHEEKPAAPATLVVVKGRAEHAEYKLEKPRTNIGRLPELTDASQRVVRRNDIVFEEGADEISATVSRKHAHIVREDGEYRLCDDRSEFGTSIFRDGRPIELVKGGRRGERLRPGDEIYFGRACVRFEQ
ncbi:MAG TPA: FHA domain-containing protein [Candidatus Acidoferrales bacterium]|nr:FHA domain-containing protein [Candidatus Acidoferrales bacterium]